ncbi:MAG: GNAT family N-acetyltransferase [Phycisphaerales bacterium JB037]
MIDIRRISHDDPLYAQARALRDHALLRPLGLTIEQFEDLQPGVDRIAEHFVAIADHPSGPRVIATATLRVDDPGSGVGRLQQMVVDIQRRGEGIGRKLIVAVESRAFGELGLSELFCTASTDACPFYQQLGWSTDGQPFDEAGIPHQRFVLRADHL